MSWGMYERYRKSRWNPFAIVTDAMFMLNYNGCGSEKGIIRTYKAIIGAAKRRHESAEKEVA